MGQVIITGASRGIGRVTARQFAAAGYEVVGTSRNPQGLDTAGDPPGLTYDLLDLCDPASIEAFCTRHPETDILIHNAGISQIGAAEDFADETIEELYQTNLFGIMRLNRFYIGKMRQRGSGKIIHVSSLAAFTPVPFSSVYASSKAGLVAYSSALRSELHQYGIWVTTVFFDFVKTTLPQLENIPEGSAYALQVRRAKRQRDRSIEEGMHADRVAQAIFRTAGRRKPPILLPIGGRTRFMYLVSRLLPPGIVERLIRLRYEL